MKTFAVCKGLELLTGKLHIFIAKMAGGKGVPLASPAGFNILLFYDGGPCLFPGVLGSQRDWGGLGKGLLGLHPRGPQPQSATHQHQVPLLMVKAFIPFTLPRAELQWEEGRGEKSLWTQELASPPPTSGQGSSVIGPSDPSVAPQGALRVKAP